MTPHPFTITHRGPWREDQVHTRYTASTRAAIPEVEAVINATWQQGLARTPKLFDGPMTRLEHLDIDSSRGVTLHLSPSSYRIFYGTNLYNPDLLDRFGPEVMSNPIGLSPILITSDNHVVFGQRNASVAYYPNRLHPFSGCLEPTDPSPFTALRRELHEELRLSPEDLGPISLLGIAEDQQLRHPELIFHLTTRKTLSDLHSSLDEEEHHALLSLPATPDSLTAALDPRSSLYPQFTPIALSTLQLFLDLKSLL